MITREDTPDRGVLPDGRAEHPACSSGFGLTATVHLVYDDALRGLLALGPAAIRRASHVEPTPDGRWTADLGPMEGPVLGPFDDPGGRARSRAGVAGAPLRVRTPPVRRVIVRSESLASATAMPPDPPEARAPVRVHAYLTALPGLLAEADLAEAHVEGRDRRTGTLVAYSFVTIHRALALHVAEAVRAASRTARDRGQTRRIPPGSARGVRPRGFARRRRRRGPCGPTGAR